MIKFDGEQVQARIKRAKLYNKISIAFVPAFMIFGLLAAVCTNYFGELGIWYLCTFCALLIAFALYNVLFVAEAGRQVKREVATVLAEGFYQSEELLKGDKNISFEVYYSGDVLTIKRTGFTEKIVISPEDMKAGGALSDGVGEIVFDLTNLKGLPAVYSCAGNYVWGFLQAYYTVNSGEGKYENIHVTDRTTKRTFELTIVDNGELLSDGKRNYFIKQGLVK